MQTTDFLTGSASAKPDEPVFYLLLRKKQINFAFRFLLIAMLILFGQILIVSIGGQFFNVVPLKITDWLIIIGVTSCVLWIGELMRLFRK